MKHLEKNKLSLAVSSALGLGVVIGLVAPMAHAQVETIPRIEVTGSRIPSRNLESTSPITQITAQDIKLTQPASVEQLLNIMPSVVADQGTTIQNGSTAGTATVNLRGLGPSRTLVLINGRPMAPGSPIAAGYAANLNEIPLPLVQRVEILTGGASAVYGSDAISGVVNFIMNDRFEGVQLEATHNFYNHRQHSFVGDIVAQRAETSPEQFKVPGDVGSDGNTEDYSMLLGGNFAGGKGNATLFVGYHRQAPISQGERDFSACALASTGSGFTCAGSSNTAPARLTPQSGPNAGRSFIVADAAGNIRPYLGTDAYNFGPANYFQAPDERWLASAFAHYDINPKARVYGEFNFHNDKTPRQIAPGADFGSVNTLSFDNPLLSDALKQTLGITPGNPVDTIIQRRNVEGGGRTYHFEQSSYRLVTGVKGDIVPGWNYDASYMYGKVNYTQLFKNDLATSKFNRALDVIRDPVTGQPACASAVSGIDPACVPWNIFANGGVTPAQLAYIGTPASEQGFTSRQVYGLTVGGDLGVYGWKSPWSTEAFGVSLGFERGVDKIELNPDAVYQSGDIEGLAHVPNAGQISRTDWFGEVRLPIVEGKPWADYLSINGSVRHTDYSIDKTSNTYGLGVEWNPIRPLKMRGSIQQAVRAPNVEELFVPTSLNLFNLSADPCGPNLNTGAGPSATAAQCARTGLSPALYGSPQLFSPAGQYQFQQGGNANLSPETSHSYTLGAVFQSRDFDASVDYYKITVKNVISTIPSSLAVNQCIATGQFCDLIHRDAQGTLWLPGQGYVTGTNLNVAELNTSGIDFTANYRHALAPAWGSVKVNFTGTYLREFKFDAGGGQGSYDCAGYYGPTCNGSGNGTIAINPLATWKHLLRGTWSTPWNLDIAATWRHIDEVKLDFTSSDPQLAGDFNAEEAVLGARDYLDLALAWTATKHVTLYAGVNNLFDRDPPIAGTSSGVGPTSSVSGNTFPGFYDVGGRRIFVTLNAKF